MDHQPRFTRADLAYINADYRTLDQLCGQRHQTPGKVRDLIAQGRTPRPAYVLPDGTEMFPPDYFALIDAAGDVDSLPGYFAARYRAAAALADLTADDTGETWEDYLSGLFGVCLRQVSTEAMALKARLMGDIERLTSAPSPDDACWRTALRTAVDALDQLERPFTDYDRVHRGTPSRDTHITSVRQRYPQAFAQHHRTLRGRPPAKLAAAFALGRRASSPRISSFPMQSPRSGAGAGTPVPLPFPPAAGAFGVPALGAGAGGVVEEKAAFRPGAAAPPLGIQPGELLDQPPGEVSGDRRVLPSQVLAQAPVSLGP